MRRALELDPDRRLAACEPLARPYVDRRVGPAPVVDEELRSDVGFRHRARIDALLLAISGHDLALDVARPVLAPDDVLRARRVHRPQHLHLLVSHRVGGEVDRRLHRGQRDELEHVVLEDVPDHAGLLVELGAAFDADRLRDRDLDVVDELAVPDRLEDAVREPQGQHVLDGLLAEVVVDPEDLFLGEIAADQLGQLAGRGEVVAERLLDDESDPALRAAPLAQPLGDGRHRLRGDGEVVDPVPARALLLVDPVQERDELVRLGLVGEVHREVLRRRRRASPRPPA